MSDRSKIEWTDATWNPIRARDRATGKVGWHCELVSEGCVHCYAQTLNGRRLAVGTGLPYTRGSREKVEIFVDEKTLAAPLRWESPRMIFPCSMTDLFGEFVTIHQIGAVIGVAMMSVQHTFQFLTKRPDRMREALENLDLEFCLNAAANTDLKMPAPLIRRRAAEAARRIGRDPESDPSWPPANCWFGVSVEDQATADKRIPALLRCPAMVRFLSYEPALGAMFPSNVRAPGAGFIDALTGRGHDGVTPDDYGGPAIDWVIAGGESGPHARPSHPDWFRNIRDQCQAAGVPFFFKQWGEWIGGDQEVAKAHPAPHGDMVDAGRVHIWPKTMWKPEGPPHFAMNFNLRVGKKAAGRLLDGREWNELPAIAPPA